MSENKQFLGLVKKGQLQILQPDFEGTSFRLTRMKPQQAQSPESAKIDLTEYEGKIIVVQGLDAGGNWIYSAEIIDQGGPILAAMVQMLFSQRVLFPSFENVQSTLKIRIGTISSVPETM
ncbi:MAG: hypothetical protein NC238_05240 [Dehalobacter sp.]|nr:hypothetical protein [Dehalobacter sp.]